MSPKNFEKGQSRSIQTSQLQNLLQFYTKFACCWWTQNQQYKTEGNEIREGHGKEWGEEEWRKGKSRGEGNIVRFAINSMFGSK